MEHPAGLLRHLQSILVDFFWDKLHWVAQSMLFLPKEEGGQGLIYLASRVVTFRFQFVQRYLIDPKDVVWRQVASALLQRVLNEF